MGSFGGWAGRVLHVDLSTGRIWAEDTIERYKDYLGGTGIGYKVLWDEVPADTHPYEPANKIVFGTGPLAGTGAPCNGRTAITTLWPTCWPKPLVASGHMGGQFAAELKYAGYDALVIGGKADSPVWLSIEDQQVEIHDARGIWGQGIRRATIEISQILGSEAVVAAIGQAGENLVPMSVVMNSVSHSAGGIGSVMGSKNLKAIGVRGTGSLRIAGAKEEWERLVKLHLSMLGANNQHVVPDSPQPWAEYYDPGSRWKASPGKKWGAAAPAIDTGTCNPHNLNRIAYRTNNAAFYLGDVAWKYTVRGNGCTGCPIRCHTLIKVPAAAAKYGIPEMGQNTCGGLNFGRSFFRTFPDGPKGEISVEASMVGMHLADDLGLWCNYSQLQRDFQKLYYDGTIRTKVGADEFKRYSWNQYEKGDPAFLFELLPRIATKEDELGTALGLGSGYLLERWSISEEEWKRDFGLQYWKLGHPKHHANEDAGQCGEVRCGSQHGERRHRVLGGKRPPDDPEVQVDAAERQREDGDSQQRQVIAKERAEVAEQDIEERAGGRRVVAELGDRRQARPELLRDLKVNRLVKHRRGPDEEDRAQPEPEDERDDPGEEVPVVLGHGGSMLVLLVTRSS